MVKKILPFALILGLLVSVLILKKRELEPVESLYFEKFKSLVSFEKKVCTNRGQEVVPRLKKLRLKESFNREEDIAKLSHLMKEPLFWLTLKEKASGSSCQLWVFPLNPLSLKIPVLEECKKTKSLLMLEDTAVLEGFFRSELEARSKLLASFRQDLEIFCLEAIR